MLARHSHRRRLFVLAMLAACDKGAQPSLRDPCGPDALGIPSAKPLTESRLPPTCTVHLAQGQTAIVRGADDVAKVFDCSASTLGVDFAKTSLVVAPRVLSEGMASYIAYDDGKTVTLVSRQLKPCPDGSHPLMGSDVYIYTIASGERAITETSCRLERKCR